MDPSNRPAIRARPSVILLAALAALLGGGLLLALGWIGLGLAGLAGLVIVQRVDLYGDNPAGQFPGVRAARHSAERMARQSRLSPEERLAEAARREQAQRTLSVVNTVCLALAALGFGMFFLHQI